jgi:hypothetical protein
MLTPMQVQALRVRLHANGFRPVPVLTCDKAPIGKDWPGTARRITADDAAQWPNADALNTGVLCDGLRAVDVDCDDPAQAHRVATLAWQMLGPAPLRARADSPRRLLLYRAASGAPRKRTIGKVEVLGQGQQFVAYGTHPSGAEYTWLNAELSQTNLSTLTVVNEDQVKAFVDALASEFPTAQGASVTVPPANGAPATERETGYAQKALEAEIGKLATMGAGSSRNNACNTAAHSLGTMVGAGWIDAGTVATALLDAMVRNGWTAKRSIDAAKATIVSGLSKGSDKPRQALVEADFGAVDPSTLKVGGKPAREALETARGTKAQPMAASTPQAHSIVLKPLSDVREEAVRWLWPGFLPAGMLTLLSGAGGTGKSTIAFSLAATVTTAGLWPDGTRCHSPGVVLIWSSEDDMARTIKPRLIAAGADIRYVAEITATDDKGIKQGFDPARDIAGLRAAVQRAGGVSLLIIDPIVSAVAGDINKANDVRRNLQPIVDFAAEFDCAVMGITHFGKNTGGRNTAERVIGSQAFAALARMVLATAKEKDSDRRVFARSKSNISADGGGFSYTIEQLTIQASDARILPTTRVVWGEAIDGSAHSILDEIEADEIPSTGKKMDAARNLLFRALGDGPVAAIQVMQQATAEGIAPVTLRRAREAMRIAITRDGFGGQSVWALPYQQLAPSAELFRDRQ